MKLRRHPSERNLGRAGGGASRSPLSSLNTLSRLESTINKRHRQKSGVSRNNNNKSPISSPGTSSDENLTTPVAASSSTKCNWTKSSGCSFISQRVNDGQSAFKQYKEPIPFDMRGFTPVTFNAKAKTPSRKMLMFGVTNTCFKDLLTEFREYRKTLDRDRSAERGEFMKEDKASNWEMVFKTPPSRIDGSSNVPRRLFDITSSPKSRGCSSQKRISVYTSTPKSQKDATESFYEFDSAGFDSENVPVPVSRPKIRKIELSPTFDSGFNRSIEFDSGIESMDTSGTSDCSEGLDRDLHNLSFEHYSKN